MSHPEQLTKRQQDVYEFIRDLIENRGYGPTVREIGMQFGISSPNGVMCHLKALEKKGLISREPNMSRAIQLVDFGGRTARSASHRRGASRTTSVRGAREMGSPNKRTSRRQSASGSTATEYQGNGGAGGDERSSCCLPLAGQVAAGVLHEAVEQHEQIDLAEMFVREGQFVLKVRGDSMIDAHIADGDFVVVKQKRDASAGQMVIAQTDDGEATLKYWYPEKNRIRLQPANASMAPIYVRDATVLGVVVGVLRHVKA